MDPSPNPHRPISSEHFGMETALQLLYCELYYSHKPAFSSLNTEATLGIIRAQASGPTQSRVSVPAPSPANVLKDGTIGQGPWVTSYGRHRDFSIQHLAQSSQEDSVITQDLNLGSFR